MSEKSCGKSDAEKENDARTKVIKIRNPLLVSQWTNSRFTAVEVMKITRSKNFTSFEVFVNSCDFRSDLFLQYNTICAHQKGEFTKGVCYPLIRLLFREDAHGCVSPVISSENVMPVDSSHKEIILFTSILAFSLLVAALLINIIIKNNTGNGRLAFPNPQ